jgi:AcrR family transcriptional regulator
MTDDRPAARTRNKEDFRRRVIETARQLFLQKGVSRTSMADLGRVLGVSKPTVYEAFRSKDLLMDAVFNSVADDVDTTWLTRAIEKPRPFPMFLDDTADGYKRLLTTPRSVEAFSLFIREGGQLSGLTNAFVNKYAMPATEAGQRVISAAIKAGECKPLDVTVVQKMIDAPLLHVLVDRTLFGKNGMPEGLVGPYIDHSFGALKTLLCSNKGA